MKAIRKRLKLVALILVIPFLFQSCAVYKSANVSLTEAVNTKLPVKITKTNGKKDRYLKVVLTDKKEYYGMNKKRINGERIDNYVLIQPQNVSKTQLKNRTASTIINIISPLVIISGIIILTELIGTGGFQGVVVPN